MKNKKKNLLVVANSIDINGALDQIKILPVGLVKSQKGDFIVDKESFDCMHSHFKSRGLEIVVDYEHQTLDNVQAPAAGWIKDFEFEEGAIVAKVEWTSKAKEYLSNKEYKYLSPVVLKRKSDNKAVILHSVALTNTPAIDNMEQIINKINDFDEEGDDEMDLLKEIAKLMGLSEDATEEQILEELKKLKSSNSNEGEIVANKAILEMLDLKEDAKIEDVTGKLIALKNPAGYVTIEKFNELAQKIQKKESDDLVEVALKSGKITPAQKEFFEEIALKDPKGFEKFIENAPQVVPLGELNIGDPKQVTQNSNLTMSINKMLGVSQEDIEKYGKEK